MDESTRAFKPELRISIAPVVVVLFAVAAGGLIVGEGTFSLRFQFYKTLLCIVPVLIGVLSLWRVEVGKWLAVTSLIAVVLLAYAWLEVPGALALVVIPIVLAAALIGLWAAATAAVSETALLLLLSRSLPAGIDPIELGLALTAIWLVLGIMYVAYRRVGYVAEWAWGYYNQAQSSLKQAQNRKVELEQALEDLEKANRQLKRLDDVARSLRQAAEDAKTAKEQFVANVSHELRTPLNMITGFCEMMMSAPEAYGSSIPQSLLADLNVIYRNAQHLGSLINDVLDLSQIEAGRMALTKEYVTLGEIIETAVIAVRPLYEAKSLDLEMDIQEDMAPVFCDRTRIREVILNLLSNAGRFTERGSVCVRAWQEQDDVCVSVADTGPGITSQDLDRAFQPFQQLDSSIRRRYGGSGLGLSISKHFIELHGGEIWVESRQGVGTTFFFRLPLSPPSPIDSGASRWMIPGWEYLQRTRRSQAPEVTVRPRLVVLDEQGSLQRLLTRYLDDAEIVPAVDIESAFARLFETPAQALLLNEASVSDTLERLYQLSALPEGTPAIVCSVPGMQQAADWLGVSDYLVKPISRDALLAALERLRLKGNTVLIVDDEPDAQTLFRRMLSSAPQPYRVLRAGNGQEALELLSIERPDAILVDLVMPDMDGFRLLEAKSRNPLLCDIPAIVISARDPAGQPIVSDALAITKQGGLSMHQLLACIEAIMHILSAGEHSPVAPMPTAVPAD